MSDMERKNDLIDFKLLGKKAEEYATTMSKAYTTDINLQDFLHDAIMAAYLRGTNDLFSMIL